MQRSSEEIREDSTLTERERLNQLKELNEQYQKDIREIEDRADRDRRRAWRDWVKIVISDFGRLVYQQLNFQLAAKVTNTILRSFGGASAAGGAVAGSGGGAAAAGGSLISGAGIGTAATAGVSLASVAVAVNGLIDPVRDLLNSFGFHNASNDQYAFEEARKAGQALFGGQSARQFGRQSAMDLVDNVTAGLAASGGGGGGSTVVNHITMKVGNREIQEIFSSAVGLDTENRLAGPGGSRVEREVNNQRVINVEVDTERAQQTATTASTTASAAQQTAEANRVAITRLAEDAANFINIRNPFD